jgi:beta-glucosidase
MPWIDGVQAVIACFLPGEGGGKACYRILSGEVNPSGKLAETFPVKLQDNPSYLNFPGEHEQVVYAEGLFVGYKYYEKKGIAPLFPFGHGLSYTAFAYTNLRVEKENFRDDETIGVTFTVKNTGAAAGKETAQLYLGCQDRGRIRPLKQLAGFRKVSLLPGEETTVTLSLGFRALAYFNTKTGDWRTDSADYTIHVGASSADIRLSKTIHVESTNPYHEQITWDTTFEDAMQTEKGRALILPLLNSINTGIQDPGEAAAYKKMVMTMPIKSVLLIGLSPELLRDLVVKLNTP